MTEDRILTIYLAGATSIIGENRKLRDRLLACLPCRILLPHDHVHCEKADEERHWQTIFESCIELMDSADCVIANLANSGRDTAAEIAYCYARGKPTIGFGGDCGRDPMVRGFLRHVVQEENALVKTLWELFEEVLMIRVCRGRNQSINEGAALTPAASSRLLRS